MPVRSPFLLLPLLFTLIAALTWAQAQAPASSSTDLTLIVLGPVGEWLYPRSIDATDDEVLRLTEAYSLALDAVKAAHPNPIVIAGDWLLPIQETLHASLAHAFIDTVQPAAIVPSAVDLAFGADRLNAAEEEFSVPVLASDLDLVAVEETQHLTRHLPIPTPSPHFSLTADVAPFSDVSAEFSSVQQAPNWTPMREITLTRRIPLAGPWIAQLPVLQSHQAAILPLSTVSGYFASRETVELLSPTASSLLAQPANRSLLLGTQLSPAALENTLRARLSFTDYQELQHAPDGSRPVFSYALFSGAQRTHRVLGVSCDPGGGFPGAHFAFLKPQSGEPEIAWFSIMSGPHAARMPNHIDALIAEAGVAGLPEETPAHLRGLSPTYQSIREALQAAAAFDFSDENLP